MQETGETVEINHRRSGLEGKRLRNKKDSGALSEQTASLRLSSCGNYPVVAGMCVHSLGRGEKSLPFIGP